MRKGQIKSQLRPMNWNLSSSDDDGENTLWLVKSRLTAR